MPALQKDFAIEGGTVRKLDWGDQEFALVDVTGEVTTVNWTSRTPAHAFVELVNDVLDIDFRTEIEMQFIGETFQVRQPIEVATQLDGRTMNSCEFMRIDLDGTRSVAWQIVPVEGFDVSITGFGDATRSIAKLGIGSLEKLMYRSASKQVEEHAILNAVHELANIYGGPEPTRTGRRVQ